MQAEGLASTFAEARHHVQHAFRQPRLKGQLGQAQGRERRLFGRFEHHAVARCQGRRELPGGHVQREVPRHHGSDHTERYAGNGGQGILRGRRDLVVELVQALGVPGEDMRGARYVDIPGVHHRLAHVQRVQQRQLFAVLQHQFGQAQQHLLALARRHACPRPLLESLARTAHRQVDFGLAAGGDPGQQLVGRRVDCVEGSTGFGIDLAAADQRLVNEPLAGSPLLPVAEIEHAAFPHRSPRRSACCWSEGDGAAYHRRGKLLKICSGHMKKLSRANLTRERSWSKVQTRQGG
ncbi:hypothetical protein D9M68_709340 [compost metagenome]